MKNQRLFAIGLVCASLLIMVAALAAQEDKAGLRVVVNLVQLNVAVTDQNGKYVTGLVPSDFEITEDGIKQTIATFGEGNEAPRAVEDIVQTAGGPKLAPRSNPRVDPATSGNVTALVDGDPMAGANVFILFDTSNYMYKGFVFAQDAISDFVRSLQGADRVAFYAYSRDIYRAAELTPDRPTVLRGVRATTAGDNAALYDALLTTLQDAGHVEGRKVVVVFSNGPDNASLVPPEDLGELAQSEGIPIYMISTREAKLEPISTAVFGRISATTGGEAFFAKTWREEQQAFAAIRDDLGHLYAVNYYPQPNPNTGWRTIKVRLVGPKLKKYRLRTRNGYRPLPLRVTAEAANVPATQ